MLSKVNRKQPAEKVALRFDFKSDREVATVRHLLEEINDEINARLKEIHDQKKHEGVQADSTNDVPEITFRSIAKALQFVKEISGVEIKSEVEEVDIRTLKAIKLIFNKSDKRVDGSGERKNSRNIFSLLQRPKKPEKNPGESDRPKKQRGRATMESCTGTTISRDPLGEALIAEIVSALSLSIDPEKLAMMETVLAAPGLCGSEQAEALSGASAAWGHALHDQMRPKKVRETRSDAEKLLDHIALGTGAVEDLLFREFGGDDRLMASVYRMITKEISKYGFSRLGRTEVPVHEALYVHVRTLGLQHFILHHRAFLADIHVAEPVNTIDKEAWLFCEDAHEEHGALFGPTDHEVPLASFEEFIQPYLNRLMALVELASGLTTPETAYEKNVGRAKKILEWAVYRRYDRYPPEGVRVCILDAVAALCSVRYQQEPGKKTKYAPYWESQQSQGTSPERMLDAIDEDSEFGLHQGVFLLYYTRYKDYLAAFTSTSESHRAFADFELCRLDAYQAAMQSRSLMEFQAATLGIDNLGLIHALDIVYANLPRYRAR